MVDFADRASKQEERDRVAAIERVTGRTHITKSTNFWCKNCEARISTARRKAVPGTPWCADCANQKEKAND